MQKGYIKKKLAQKINKKIKNVLTKKNKFDILMEQLAKREKQGANDL